MPPLDQCCLLVGIRCRKYMVSLWIYSYSLAHIDYCLSACLTHKQWGYLQADLEPESNNTCIYVNCTCNCSHTRSLISISSPFCSISHISRGYCNTVEKNNQRVFNISLRGYCQHKGSFGSYCLYINCYCCSALQGDSKPSIVFWCTWRGNRMTPCYKDTLHQHHRQWPGTSCFLNQKHWHRPEGHSIHYTGTFFPCK